MNCTLCSGSSCNVLAASGTTGQSLLFLTSKSLPGFTVVRNISYYSGIQFIGFLKPAVIQLQTFPRIASTWEVIFSSVKQAYWDFYCSGFWFRGLWHRLFILYLAYFFCQIKSVSITQSSTTVVWGDLCLGIPDRWWGTKSHITYKKQTSHIQVCWRFSSQKRSRLAFFFSQVQ